LRAGIAIPQALRATRLREASAGSKTSNAWCVSVVIHDRKRGAGIGSGMWWYGAVLELLDLLPLSRSPPSELAASEPEADQERSASCFVPVSGKVVAGDAVPAPCHDAATPLATGVRQNHLPLQNKGPHNQNRPANQGGNASVRLMHTWVQPPSFGGQVSVACHMQ
jgi:hypothetical protein